jgi:nicotinamidase-related amidase
MKLTLDPQTTALVLIDLQNGILGYPLAPTSPQDLVARGKRLAERFRGSDAPVALVNVGWSADGSDTLAQPVDAPQPHPEGGYPSGWTDLVNGLAQPGDILVTKRQWGAFYGTELDLQLRRRGIKTIVLGGVATHMGVESTARQAWELGYAVVIAVDATSSVSVESHEMSMRHTLPHIARVRDSGDIDFEVN